MNFPTKYIVKLNFSLIYAISHVIPRICCVHVFKRTTSKKQNNMRIIAIIILCNLYFYSSCRSSLLVARQNILIKILFPLTADEKSIIIPRARRWPSFTWTENECLSNGVRWSTKIELNCTLSLVRSDGECVAHDRANDFVALSAQVEKSLYC